MPLTQGWLTMNVLHLNKKIVKYFVFVIFANSSVQARAERSYFNMYGKSIEEMSCTS